MERSIAIVSASPEETKAISASPGRVATPADILAVVGVVLKGARHGYVADRVPARGGMVGLLAFDVMEELPAPTATLAERAPEA